MKTLLAGLVCALLAGCVFELTDRSGRKCSLILQHEGIDDTGTDIALRNAAHEACVERQISVMQAFTLMTNRDLLRLAARIDAEKKAKRGDRP